MPAKSAKKAKKSIEDEVQYALSSLEEMSTDRDRENLTRFGINAKKAFLASRWPTSRFSRNALDATTSSPKDSGSPAGTKPECSRAFIDEPEQRHAGQMDRWCRDFDNWAICDTACFHLFDNAACFGQGRRVA